MTEKNRSGVTIRQLRMWEIPQLLLFRKENDYKAAFENEGIKYESLITSLLKTVWYGNKMITLVAIKDRVIIGYISLFFGKQKIFKGNVHLANAAVKISERNKGIGTLLFNAVEDYARSRGAHRIEFDVFSGNTGAIRLYKRLGYETEGVKRRAVKNSQGFHDLIFMAKFI